jgi:hypothetical protein
MAVDTSNYLFFVEFEPLSHTFTCQFVGHYGIKSCEITYGAVDPTDQSCRMENHITRRVNGDVIIITDTVTIVLPGLEHTDSEYCFTAVGKTEIFTIAVEGTFKIGIIYISIQA